MLNLPQVTLCCVDTRLPALAMAAMRHCLAQARFADALLFTRPDHGLTDVPEGLRVLPAPEIRSTQDYSRFMLKGLAPHLASSHMLVVQWDGYVLHPEAWQDAFLEMDYIGAVWPQYDDTHNVGNGGFSLRSLKLLKALEAADVAAQHPEDVCIARTYRAQLEERHGIRFALPALAESFAFERTRPPHPTFGFHGLSNMADLLDEAALRRFVATAPDELFASVEARGFIKTLVARGLLDDARTALGKRRLGKPADLADARLWLRLWLRGGRRRPHEAAP